MLDGGEEYQNLCSLIRRCHKKRFVLASRDAISGRLKTGENGNYYFWSVFKNFLMWEQESHYTDEQKCALPARGGLYYELHKDFVKALEFYSKSNQRNRKVQKRYGQLRGRFENRRINRLGIRFCPNNQHLRSGSPSAS